MRYSRLIPAFGALVALALLVACQAPAAAPASPPKATAPPGATVAPNQAAKPKPSGPQILTVGLVGVGRTPDLYDLGVQSGRNWRFHVGQTLTTLITGEPTGQIAASFRATAPDVWEFKLGNQKFSTGDPVTADDVLFSYQRAIGLRNNAPEFPLLLQQLTSVERVTVVAADTVTFTTRGPDPILPNKLASFFIVSKKAIESLGVERGAQIGSGPYRLDALAPDTEAVISINPNWSGTRPTLEKITFKQIGETATRLAALQAGDVDAVEAIGLNNAKTLREPFYPVIRAANLITGTIFDVRKPELRSKDVRYGLNLAVDRRQIIAAFMDNKVEPGNQIVTSDTFGHNPAVPQYEYNVARAREFIARGGFPGGFNTVLGYAPIVADYKGFAEALQSQFAQAGVRADIELIDPAQFIPRYLALTLPAMFMASYSSSNYLDALEAMRFRSVPPTSAYYGNEAFNQLFNQASIEIDRTRRLAIMREAMKMSHEDPPGILGWGFAEAWGVSRRVIGFDSLPANQIPQWQLMARAA